MEATISLCGQHTNKLSDMVLLDICIEKKHFYDSIHIRSGLRSPMHMVGTAKVNKNIIGQAEERERLRKERETTQGEPSPEGKGSV